MGVIDGESDNRATCFSWMDTSRIAIGHSDGSITIWSIWPKFLLQRLRAHRTYILDICSGYPSHPNMITSHPVSGHSRLIDLSNPSCEMTFSPNPTINFQFGLSQWCELLQGFISFAPASYLSSTAVAFMHVRHYARQRSIFTGYATSTAVAIGVVHPYLLVGCIDGSLWASNSIRKVMSDKDEKVYKIKLFEHEFRPTQDSNSSTLGVRGAVRFLQGFAPDINDNIRARKVLEKHKNKKAGQKRKRAKAKVGSKAKGKADVDAMDLDDDSGVESLDDDTKRDWEPEKRIVHEPLTRISAVAWNPNLEFGWWAAAGMASGLVRIMDLGVEHSKGPEHANHQDGNEVMQETTDSR